MACLSCLCRMQLQNFIGLMSDKWTTVNSEPRICVQLSCIPIYTGKKFKNMDSVITKFWMFDQDYVSECCLLSQ